ncbi:uncharacterized protein LOC5518642 isoform X3 [Nematostella vectensis]|uniref:uncharacterized protein LOC5518642 isoform X3 n=1 Tax=Nematostella vectensis TaxID=45351 RepID=UPI00207720F0|nr:uncharacterized protein LOC5518642 isoform X3 [Nematostella vectensis]
MAQGFLTVAILVGVVAVLSYYAWQNEEVKLAIITAKEQLFQGTPVSYDKSEIPSKSRTEGEKKEHYKQERGKGDRTEKSDREHKDDETGSRGKSAQENEQKENAKKAVPRGHLKYLGEHGSPIIQGEIEELDFVPNGKDFYEHFVRQRKPVVLRGAIKNWPAVKHWSNESYLAEKYGDIIFDVQFTKKYETILPIKKTMNLKEYLKIYKKENVYLDCPFPHSPMTQDILVPYNLQCPELLSGIASTHLLFSSGNTSSSIHYDGYENLLSLVSGTKEVLVANYSYTDRFYHRNYTTVNIEAPIDPEAVDLLRFPKIAEVPFHKVTLNAGDILYIPQTWWHHVRSFDSPNIGIALWFHMFKEEEAFSEATEEDEDEIDALKYMAAFKRLVDRAPSTIECRSQNRPVSEVFWPKGDEPNQPNREDPDKWTTILASGYKMPMLGFGTAGLFEDAQKSIVVALKEGYRMIDTAQARGYDEASVGLAIKESGVPREDIFIVSKVEPRNLGYEDTLRSVEESLKKLKTSYIDLMLIHAMECEMEPEAFLTCGEGEPRGTWQDSWRALEELVSQGKIRSIGVSNFEVKDLKKLKDIAKVPPSAIQNFFTPFYQDKATRQYCKENNIKYMGYSTLGGMYVREGFDKNPVQNNFELQRIGGVFDATVSQVVLKWALEQDVLVIPQSRTPNHIRTNFHLDHVQLDSKQMAYFDSLDGLYSEQEDEEVAPVSTKTAKEEPKAKEEEEPKKPVRDPSIIDKLTLVKKVDPSDATLYVSSDDQVIYALDAKTGDLMWKYGTAEDGGSMCAFSPDETVLYCGTDDNFIRAFNRLDGTLLWKFKTEGAVTSSTRVGTDGTLFVGCVDGHIYCIKPDGTLKWKKHLGDQVWATPALQDGGRVVFIASMAQEPHNVFALQGETGEVLWQRLTGGPVFASPALSADESTVYVCSFDANCYAYESATGKIMWVFEADASFQSSPALSKSRGLMFVTSTEGNMFCVRLSDGKIQWIHKSKGEFFSTAFVAADNRVYVGSGTGNVLALNQSDGSLIWSFKTETDDMVYSSPKMTKDGTLYIGGVDGYLNDLLFFLVDGYLYDNIF